MSDERLLRMNRLVEGLLILSRHGSEAEIAECDRVRLALLLNDGWTPAEAAAFVLRSKGALN